MTLDELYKSSVEKLKNIENIEIDVRIILKKVLSFSETDFLINKNRELSSHEVQTIGSMIDKREKGIPVQYIIGEWDFYGTTFKVNDSVLIPRPETEILCEYVINYLRNKNEPVIADLCTGSGCIGITVKKYIGDATVVMVEKSPEAAEVCLENIKSILGNDKVFFINEDVFLSERFKQLPQFDVIVSNPPYIKSSEISSLQSEVLFEPEIALDGGDDGLDFYRLFAEKWTEHLKPDGMFAFECGEDQANDIKSILEEKNFDVYIKNDYNNIERFVIGKRR
ncbi:MAG: peptide chain release factor N(5)-glutamine methyltransferase [Clostridia bacterium]|nr:peptide chain release factor N(5)-glutamine methyltransferase [Clostridia bacterium]